MCLTKIYSIFFSYSTDKTESPCGNPRYTQCLKCFSYLLTAVDRIGWKCRRLPVNEKRQIHSRKRPIVQTPQNGLIPQFLPYSRNHVRVFKNRLSGRKWKWTSKQLTGIKRKKATVWPCEILLPSTEGIPIFWGATRFVYIVKKVNLVNRNTFWIMSIRQNQFYSTFNNLKKNFSQNSHEIQQKWSKICNV